MIDETDRKTAQSPTTLPAFKKHFICIISLDSQATASSFPEEDSEAGTGTVTPSSRKSTRSQCPGPQGQTHALCKAPRARGLQEGSTHSLSYRTFNTEEKQPCIRSLHEEIFIEILLCARCWLRSQGHAMNKTAKALPLGFGLGEPILKWSYKRAVRPRARGVCAGRGENNQTAGGGQRHLHT